MTHEEELTQLVEMEREHDMIPFLQRLTTTERKAITPAVKKLVAYYSEIIAVGQNRWGSRMSVAQNNMFTAAAFVCYDKASFQKSHFVSALFRNGLFEKLTAWYVPAWFDEMMVEMAEKDTLPGDLTYGGIIDLAAKKMLTPTPAMIVARLPMAIFDRKSRITEYDTSILVKDPVTLSEHFWYLFELPSNIHFSDRWGTGSSKHAAEEHNWKGAIKHFTKEGKLDRMRVLEECLKTANRNFNKLLTGWFMDLFISLEPTQPELLHLQPLLFLTLDSPQSKAVSTALSYIKLLSGEKEFDYQLLADHLPQIISTDKKSIITTTIAILEKVCKKYPAVQDKVCLELCQAFVSKDEDVQGKAAKLILQYGGKDAALKEQLSLFRDSMLTSTQKTLQSFFDGDIPAAVQEHVAGTSLPLIGAHNELPAANDPAALVFLASQAFENNEAYHIDQLPAALIAMQDTITTDVLLQMEPAFHRAAAVFKRPPGNTGLLDQALALFFLNYGKLMADARPDYAEQLNILKNAQHWWRNRLETPQLGSWKTSRSEPAVYMVHRKLLVLALQKITDKDTLPLLSTPTHTPAWIDPVVLVERLQLYQQRNATPDELDLQIAISRCALEDTTAAAALAEKLPEREYKQLMKFLLDKPALPQGPFTIQAAWMQAGITKAPKEQYESFRDFSYSRLPVVIRNGDFEWSTATEPYHAYGTYDTKKGEYNRYWAEQTVMRIRFPQETGDLLLKGPNPLLQEYLNGVGKYLSISIPDIRRILLLTPNNPSILLARIMDSCCSHAGLSEVQEVNTVSSAIQTLHELDIIPAEMGYLFVSCSMLNADKTVRAFAAEYWNSRVPDKIDSVHLGRIIGIHQRIQWAPLKRFCDLITANMLQVSQQHNHALEAMLTACLECFEATPVKDLKKLLEIYSEVLSLNGTNITSQRVAELLTAWQANSTLKKVAVKLQQLVTATV